jgi:hypothetical protein
MRSNVRPDHSSTDSLTQNPKRLRLGLAHRRLNPTLISTARRAPFSMSGLAAFIGTTPERLSRWLCGHSVPRSTQANAAILELCQRLCFPYADAFISESPTAEPVQQYDCASCGATNESPLLCTSCRTCRLCGGDGLLDDYSHPVIDVEGLGR